MQLPSLLEIVWNVNPEIIEGFHVRWYGLFFAVGFMISYYVLAYIFKKENKPVQLLDSLTFTVFICLIIGLRLGHCLFYQPDYYLSHPIEILKVWQGGLASHGGAIGILVAFFIFYKTKKDELKNNKITFMWIFSRAIIVIPFTGAMVRLGNLMNSEIYGIATDMPWGFVFVRDGQNIARHPTQIYEALAYFTIFAILFIYYLKAQKQNRISENLINAIGVGAIFGFRFFIEFIKVEQVEFEKNMTLDMGQWLSIPFVALAGFFLYRHFKSQKLEQ